MEAHGRKEEEEVVETAVGGSGGEIEREGDTKNEMVDDKKSIYLELTFDHIRKPEWVSIDPDFNVKSSIFPVIYPMRHPKRLARLERYECAAVCDTLIYFIGGSTKTYDYYCSPDFSAKVSVYDIKLMEWSKGPDLNIPRAFPIVVSIGRKIFVFGGLVSRDKDYTNKEWAEFLDLDDEDPDWEFLPDSAPSGAFAAHPLGIGFHAVYERRNQILLWYHTHNHCKATTHPPQVAVYAYDYVSQKWVHPPSIDQHSGPLSIYPPLIVGDVLIWHYFERIYGYNLLTDQKSFLLHEFPLSLFGEPFFRGDGPLLTFLVPIGGSKLCLIWCAYRDGEHCICCYRFQISSSKEGHCNRLAIDAYFQLPVSAPTIFHALPVPLMYPHPLKGISVVTKSNRLRFDILALAR